jgi:katanin p80 WD40 repeat-containing subunit B1
VHLFLKLQFLYSDDTRGHKVSRDACSIESKKGGKKLFLYLMFVSDHMKFTHVLSAKYSGKTRSLVVNWEKRERSPTYEGSTSSIPPGTVSAANMLPFNAV